MQRLFQGTLVIGLGELKLDLVNQEVSPGAQSERRARKESLRKLLLELQ